ncbi:MAG TPA: tetratricopeptide repeat protein [Candidatus Rifleibacterium sp.]|nr:tetratricopeptide repeat protein [Candidatus Rifleibacterium sp.]HPW57125.1 tetratricopeptide repeat protein [Candidatus Rifleibacterium sp.]
MDTSRERILKVLCELVGRKDATVFQSPDIFERMLQKAGNLAQSPETAALRAGLQERIPWELQKGYAGVVARSLINSLAAGIGRKHSVNPALAAWAVESWAISLGLKVEAETAHDSAAEVSPPATQSAAIPTLSAETMRLFEKNRAGLIFGTDASGVIKVFSAWWRPLPETDCAGLMATAVKAEKSGESAFFAAAPRKRQAVLKSTSAAAAQTVSTQVSQPVRTPQTAAQPVAPAKPPVPKPAPVQPAARPAAPAGPAAPPKPAAPVVLTGSAEELVAQAKTLLPGYGTRVDVPLALQMLQQAAKLGSIVARRMIGEIYHKGLGVKQDFATAANWFRLAADAGDMHAQFYLGTLYQCGMGVEFSLEKANSWLQKAAAQGHKEANTLLKEILQA